MITYPRGVPFILKDTRNAVVCGPVLNCWSHCWFQWEQNHNLRQGSTTATLQVTGYPAERSIRIVREISAFELTSHRLVEFARSCFPGTERDLIQKQPPALVFHTARWAGQLKGAVHNPVVMEETVMKRAWEKTHRDSSWQAHYHDLMYRSRPCITGYPVRLHCGKAHTLTLRSTGTDWSHLGY